MNKTSGIPTLILILILASSITIVKPSFAQSIPKPAVPEFTIQYADNSYSIPAYTSTDPFTGKTAMNQAQYINNQTIQITVKNQTIPKAAYLYYEIRMKGSYSQEWANISFIRANPHSDYTALVYAINGNNASSYFTSRLDEISSGGSADFQVQAQIWHQVQSNDIFGSWYEALWAASDWSNTQTLTIESGEVKVTETTTSPSPVQSAPSATTEPTVNSTEAPVQPNTQTEVLSGITWKDIAIVAACGVIAVLAIMLVLSRRKMI